MDAVSSMNKSALVVVCFFMAFCGCNPNSKTTNNKMAEMTKPSNNAMPMIKSFYTEYIKENAKEQPSESYLINLKSKHCTKSFLKILNTIEIDADPFLNVQDFEPIWSEKLQIKNVNPDDLSNYQVCIPVSYSNSVSCVNVHVVQEGKEWLIDNVTW